MELKELAQVEHLRDFDDVVERHISALGARGRTALVLRNGHNETTSSVRLLVVTDLGLYDMTWAPPDGQADAPWQVSGVLRRWVDSGDISITSSMTTSGRPSAPIQWTVEIATLGIKAVRSEAAADGHRSVRTLLEFATECVKWSDLRTLQRLYKLTSSSDAAAGLLDDGLASAQDILGGGAGQSASRDNDRD